MARVVGLRYLKVLTRTGVAFVRRAEAIRLTISRLVSSATTNRGQGNA
jgi:hypothetical protein